MTKKIWIVSGQTGEYSNRSEWSVRAFATEGAAQDFVIRVSEQYREIAAKHGGPKEYYYSDDYQDFRYWKDDEIGAKQESPVALDPNFKTDYTGTNYYIEDCEFEDR